MDTQALYDFVYAAAVRGACRCGRCVDAPSNAENKQPDGHTANVHFFEVALSDPNTDKKTLASGLRSLLALYPQPERLAAGLSYIELDAVVGDQGMALTLIGLGELVGLWQAITPELLGFTGEQAAKMAGRGLVMCSGLRPENALA